jgi:hypothetical protein
MCVAKAQLPREKVVNFADLLKDCIVQVFLPLGEEHLISFRVIF